MDKGYFTYSTGNMLTYHYCQIGYLFLVGMVEVLQVLLGRGSMNRHQ